MLWHGGRACRRGDQAPARVVWHSTHESASPSTGPRVPAGGVRQAGRVPAEPRADNGGPLESLRWLRTADGTAAARLAARLQSEGVGLIPGLARLRAEVGPERAGPAWELARLRARARPVFGADADRMFWTADTLEQAGRPELAARRAARLLAGGPGPVADLGCGAGTDTLALARAGARVVAVDRDPVARELTASNVAALGLADRVQVVDADVVDLVAAARDGAVAGCPVAVLDPARRADGRRLLDPDRWSPPWSTVAALLDRVPRTVIKVAPGLAHERVPEGVEAEWVSVGGSIAEALLWGVGPARAWRRATLVGDDGVLELPADADPGTAPVGPVRRWLHEPDPAVIRSGLVAPVAAALGATLIDPLIAYLSSDGPARSPWVRDHRIDIVLPFSLKRLRSTLRGAGVGRVTVKKRGSAVDPATLAGQLRGPGRWTAVVVVTRGAGAPTALVCDLSA